jgi:hypothetical protein
VNIASLSKTKAVFELKPLTTNTWDDIPLEAADASSMAMNTLQTFYSMVENKRNASEHSLACHRTRTTDEPI